MLSRGVLCKAASALGPPALHLRGWVKKARENIVCVPSQAFCPMYSKTYLVPLGMPAMG